MWLPVIVSFEMTSTHIVWHPQIITRSDREHLNQHKSCVLWFTGLSGSGKSTIANIVAQRLHERSVRCYVLDGDNLRHGLNASPVHLKERHGETFANRFGLTFSVEDREENIRRVGCVAGLFCDAGIIALAAFVSPYRTDREAIRNSLASGDFIEIFVDTPLEICEARDPKGLYKKARRQELKNFTGIDDTYEAPIHPELVLSGGKNDPQVLASEVIYYLVDRAILS